MSQSGILIALGVLVILAPFSGIPLAWQEFILPAIGLAIAVIGYSSRKRHAEIKVDESLTVAA